MPATQQAPPRGTAKGNTTFREFNRRLVKAVEALHDLEDDLAEIVEDRRFAGLLDTNAAPYWNRYYLHEVRTAMTMAGLAASLIDSKTLPVGS